MHKPTSMAFAVGAIVMRAMNERDLRALYRYIRSVGPAGEPAPDYVPPGRKPRGPTVQFPG